MLSKKENRDEQVILRDLYRDKEFLRYGMLISCCPEMIFSKKGNNLFQVSIRSLFLRLEENKEIQCILEEGFIFLTERLNDQTRVDIFRSFCKFLLNFSSSQTYRSDFWRNQKPMYVEEGERVTRRMSMMEDTQTRMKRGPDKTALFTIRLNI